MCTEGEFSIQYHHHKFDFQKGDTILLPSILTEFQLIGEANLLEITIE